MTPKPAAPGLLLPPPADIFSGCRVLEDWNPDSPERSRVCEASGENQQAWQSPPPSARACAGEREAAAGR